MILFPSPWWEQELIIFKYLLWEFGWPFGSESHTVMGVSLWLGPSGVEPQVVRLSLGQLVNCSSGFPLQELFPRWFLLVSLSLLNHNSLSVPVCLVNPRGSCLSCVLLPLRDRSTWLTESLLRKALHWPQLHCVGLHLSHARESQEYKFTSQDIILMEWYAQDAEFLVYALLVVVKTFIWLLQDLFSPSSLIIYI